MGQQLDPRHLMRSPRICRRALLIGHLKANPQSKDAGRKLCAVKLALLKLLYYQPFTRKYLPDHATQRVLRWLLEGGEDNK